VQQRIELGDQVLDLACGNPLGEGLEYRVGDLPCRRLVDVQPLLDPASELAGRHDVQVSVPHERRAMRRSVALASVQGEYGDLPAGLMVGHRPRLEGA
jgi:hypothetical protein